MLLLTSLGAAPAQSVLSLTGPVPVAALPASLDYRIDPEWQLSVADLADPASSGWQPVGDETPDFGYTPARIWLRVALQNATPGTSDWRLYAQANFFPSFQVWQVGAGGVITPLLDITPTSPFGDRAVAHPQVVVPFRLSPGEQAVLLLAYSSQGSSRNAMSIETAESFAQVSAQATAKTYLFYGMILVLLAVTSIAVVVLRQMLFVIYGGYVLSLFLYIAHIDGTTFQYLWPQNPDFNNMASVVAGSTAMIFAALFAIVFLQTRRFHPVMHGVLLALIGSVLALDAVLWVVDPQLLKKSLVIMLSISALIILTTAIIAALKRYHEVRYYLFAWFAAFIPAGLFTARHIFAFEPDFIAPYDAVRGALIFDAYMMGFATFDQLRQSRERALAESLAMAQRNLMLGERLALLDESYERLSTRARQREENVLDAVHDLRQPMHALRLSMRQRFVEGQQGADSGQIEAALSYMEQLVADRLASRADDSAVALEAAPRAALASDEPALHEVLRGVAEMFAPEASAKGLSLTLRLGAPDGPVAAYPLMRALANLVSNAIKYTKVGRVLITLRPRAGGWRIEVHDTGPGLGGAIFEAALARAHRLERDRDETEGSGLGLAIVTEIASAQGWTISSCHRRQTGASIRVDIPARTP